MSQLLINIKLAWESIKTNKLRAFLTLSIIAIGIWALVGILTAADGLKGSITNSFTNIGANSFTIRQSGMGLRRHGSMNDKIGPPIRYEQATLFKEKFNYPAVVSISTMATYNAIVQHESDKTNPNVHLMGVDENYLVINSGEVESGRFFSSNEVKEGANVAVLGPDVVTKIFPANTRIVNEYVQIGTSRYLVIGILKSKGSSMMASADNQVFIPVLNASRNYLGNNNSYTISVAVSNINTINDATEEATSLLHSIRRLRIGQAADFDVRMSDAMANMALENISFVTFAATLIGIITLFGAGIGLMNIMLVLVTERTREIGVSKALGATKGNIRMQFLTEALVICLLGGILGVILGVITGNIISQILKNGFIIPWTWMFAGISFCFLVGVAAGIYPAIKASRLDPIDALRYE